MASKSKATTTDALATNRSLPKGWRMVRFDELAQMVNERVDPSKTDAEIYIGLEHLDPDSLKLRRWGTPSDVIGDKLQFRKGDIIFGRRRAYQRKLAVAEFDGICSAHAMVVRVKSETVDPEFLPLLMQSDVFMQRAIDISVGSLSPTINWTTLRIQEFPLPPKDEQRRIAEILWAADEVVARHQEVAESTSQLENRVLDRVLSEGCREQELQDSEVGRIPSGWHVRRYEDITDRLTYGFTNPMPTTDEGPWMVTATNINDGRIDYSSTRHTSLIAYATLLTDKSRPRVGDVLLTKDGTLGRVAVVDQDATCINQSVALLQPNLQIVTSKYLAWTLRAPKMQKRLIAEAGGSAIKHIYITKLAITPVAVPPLDEQREIVDVIEATHSARRLSTAHLHEAVTVFCALRESLMRPG